jgi:hypothetical protein
LPTALDAPYLGRRNLYCNRRSPADDAQIVSFDDIDASTLLDAALDAATMVLVLLAQYSYPVCA